MASILGVAPIMIQAYQALRVKVVSIDVLVTDHGIAVNPARPEIRERLLEAGLKVVDISALYERAISLTGVPKPIEFTDKIVGVIRYRDGSVIDTVRQVKE